MKILFLVEEIEIVEHFLQKGFKQLPQLDSANAQNLLVLNTVFIQQYVDLGMLQFGNAAKIKDLKILLKC